MEIINWIEQWFLSQCDGGWEHSYSIKIESLDNPGWALTVDVGETGLDGLSLPYELVEHSEDDWYGVDQDWEDSIIHVFQNKKAE